VRFYGLRGSGGGETMGEIKLKNMETRVYPPLVDGAPPEVPEPEADTPPFAWRKAVALAWYICHVAIVGAVVVTLIVDAEGYCTSPLQPVAAVPGALLLWGVTILVWRWAQREGSYGRS